MNRWTGTSRYARLDRRTIMIAVVIAYGVGLWTHVVHWRSGAREAHDVTFWSHWLRDSTLSIPLVLLAVLAATMAIGQKARIVRTSSAVAAAVAAALALGVPVHAGIFGHAAHHGAVPALPVSMVAEFLIDLPVALLICAAVLGLAAVSWPARRALRTRERVALLMAALFTIGIITIPTSQASAVTPPSVCAAGAVIRAYDVTMIDVDIPLNRWGDHDPAGKMYALTSQIPAIRDQEITREVSLGLRDDPIQPLVIRANQGDCVEITLRNSASGGAYGVHIDGLPYDRAGDKVGKNSSGEVPSGQTAVFRYFVPDLASLEGAHYISPGAGHRAGIDHGLFGVLSVEPPGSRWLSPVDATTPIESGWEAIIWPQNEVSFREDVQILHEIGNEKDDIYDKNNKPLPTVDPITEAYRPGSRGMNYRAEPFLNRLNLEAHEKSHAYSSSMFGDPATIIPQGYLGDPTKFRVVHGGAELFHIYHLHGGGDRWRANPEADPTNKYSYTGLYKEPVEVSNSDRVDAMNTGPGESFNAEIEGGAGGVQQSAGDFLFHCHIAEHYPSGMWGLWRVFDTLQPGLAPLPDRLTYEKLPPAAVTSDQLIGKQMPDGTVLTKENLASWIAPQLPPQGIAIGSQDPSVWDWTVATTAADAPLYLGEPEPTFAETPNFTEGVPDHFGSRPGDLFVGDRPVILFNPYNGRPAWPMIRPHLDRRPPFAPNLHTGAPWLGETADAPPTPGVVDPWAGRQDGLCPATATVNKFNVVAVQTPVDVTPRKSDPGGLLFTLAENKDALLSGQLKKEPLAIRMNVGDCGAVTLTSEETDKATFGGFAKVEMHIHHVQFDPQGSDGTSIGYAFEHSIRPYTIEDTKLAVAAAIGSTSVTLNRIDPKYRPGVAFGVGLGKDSIEEATIVSVDPSTKTIVLDRPLVADHAAGEGAGIEFIRYRWYADALLDNIFWHDHVDGIHGWGHGGVGMLIIEPKGSTYHDPTSGAEVRSGTVVDIHSHPYSDGTYHPLAKGLVDGSFREMVIWTLDDNPVTDSTINLHAAPFSDRGTDPSLRFSSYKWGDPGTPLLRAYPGDPVVIRAIHVGPTIDSFRVDGHHFYVEKRARSQAGEMYSRVTDTIHSGVSERYTLILDGGAGGVSRQPGDYLYHNGIARRFRQGAWGILRVLPQGSPGLLPLPDNAAPAGTYVQPAVTGGRPPATVDPGSPCPAGSTSKAVAISAVDVPNSVQGTSGKNGTSTNLNGAITAAYVMTSNAAVAKAKGVTEPLVVHVNKGDCLTINFTNQRTTERASMAIGELDKSASSSGVNVGFSSEQTVAPGASQTYRVYADTLSIESAVFTDFGGNDTGKIGLYGAIVVGEPGAWFSNPVTGAPTMTGALVDVHLPGGQPSYRDNTLFLQDNDPQIGSDFMPYPIKTDGLTLVNYRNAGRRTDDYSGSVATPLLQAYVGDPMKIHVLSTPGSEQPHVFRAGGLSWLRDPYLPESQEVAEQGLAPYQGIDVHLIDGAGGRGHQTGDFFYGDNRRAFTESGMWGVLRVLPKPSCTATAPIRRLDGAPCT